MPMGKGTYGSKVGRPSKSKNGTKKKILFLPLIVMYFLNKEV